MSTGVPQNGQQIRRFPVASTTIRPRGVLNPPLDRYRISLQSHQRVVHSSSFRQLAAKDEQTVSSAVLKARVGKRPASRSRLADVPSIASYNYARRLKTLRGLTPYEFICKTWGDQPHRFTASSHCQ